MTNQVTLPKAPNGAQPGYRPDIDGLRAIAVIAVIAFHAYPNAFGGGFVGVDVFFVISGFLISGIILNGLEQGAFRFTEFYRRRIRRIFPALIIVLVACLVLGWIALLPDEYKQLGKHIAAGAGFLANVTLWKESGYFDTLADRKPLLHLWSLGIEEQFYLVWPLCLVLLWKLKKSVRVLLSVTLLALLSFALNLRWMEHPNASFYLPFTRFWELLLGCILVCATQIKSGSAESLVGRSSVDSNPYLRNSYAVFGCVLVGLSLLMLNRNRPFPGSWALLPTLGAALLILAGPHAWINRKVLSDPRVVFVGLISYPLYLWHWPLLSLSRIIGIQTNALRLLLIAVSFILAWATWKYVEGNVRQRRIPRDIAFLTITLALTGMLGYALFLTDGFAGRRQAEMASALLMDVSSDVRGPDCSVRPRSFDICVQTKPGPVDAIVLGDSHAKMFIPGLAAADTKRNWLAVGNTSCPPALGIIAEDDGLVDKPDCAAKMNEVFDYLRSPNSPRLVVLSFFGYYAETTDVAADHLQNGAGPSHYRLESDQPLQGKEEVLILGLRNALRLLLSQNKTVILVVDIPELPFFPRDCIQRPFMKRAPCLLERAAVDQRQRGLSRVVKELQREFPPIAIFNPLPLLCGDVTCNPVRNDFSFYQDSHHLSARGSEIVARSLLAVIDERINPDFSPRFADAVE